MVSEKGKERGKERAREGQEAEHSREKAPTRKAQVHEEQTA